MQNQIFFCRFLIFRKKEKKERVMLLLVAEKSMKHFGIFFS